MNTDSTPRLQKRLERERRRLEVVHGIDREPIQHYRRPAERAFTSLQRDETTVLFGGLSPRHDAFVEGVLIGLGYKARALPNPSLKGYELAKEYGNNGQCNPTYFTVGALVRHLQELEAGGMSRSEIVDSHVFFTAGSCGTCRFGMYEAEYRLALTNAGFDAFRVLVFGTDDGIDQSAGVTAGLEFDLDFFLGLINAFNAADVLNQFVHRVRPFEAEPGDVDRVTAGVIDELRGFFATRPTFDLARSRARLLARTRWSGAARQVGGVLNQVRRTDHVEAMKAVRRAYDAVRLDPFQVKPVVKLIGEFWAQTTEGDGNFNMHAFLEREGADVYVDRSLFTRLTYLLHMHKQMAKDRRGLIPWSGYLKKRGLLTLAEWILKRENDRLLDALGGTLHEMASQYELERLARPFWNWRTSSGESHLEIAENIYYHSHHLCHMVLSLKPFTCMPSTQSDGVQAKVVEHFPGMIFLPIETSGDGEVIAHSRVQMALGAARTKARVEMTAALERAGRPLAEMQAYVADRPELTRATYAVPHHDGVVGRAANFVLHVAALMAERPASVPVAAGSES